MSHVGLHHTQCSLAIVHLWRIECANGLRIAVRQVRKQIAQLPCAMP